VIAYENLFDLLVLLLIITAFIVGYLQGSLRRLLGIAATIFSVMVAAQLREPLGDFLISNWTQFHPDYSRMLGFFVVFAVLTVAFTIAIEAFYDRSPILPRYPLVDPILGGLLGMIQAVIFLGILVIIADSWFKTPNGQLAGPAEILFLREFYHAIDVSQTAHILRNDVIPIFFLAFGGLFPQDIRDLFPKR
jgi:uncharacterized membrane protein required for colicin V production